MSVFLTSTKSVPKSNEVVKQAVEGKQFHEMKRRKPQHGQDDSHESSTGE